MSSHLPTSRDFSRGFIRLFCGSLFTIGVLFNSNSQTCGGSITSNVTFTGNITCSSGIIIDANNITIDGGGYTIYMSSSSSAIQMHGKTGVTIKNLNVVYTSSPGISLYVSNSSGCTIENNDFSNASTALRFDGSNSTNTIDNNNMSDAASIALHFTNGNNQGNIITNNQIKSDTHYGIYYNYGTPGEIHNNDLTNSLNGIFLSGATNFSFTSPSSAGPNKNIYGGHTSNVLYYQSANGGTIEDWDMSSLITDPTGQIALSVNSVRNMVIQNNDFTGGFSTALRLDGSNSTNTIDNNNMSDAASIALHFTNGNNQGNIITNNQIKSDTHYGIYYNYGTPGEIHNNDLTNSLNGIFLSGATNFSFTSPSSAGPNKNIYGGHTSNVLYYQSANGGTIEDWDMSSLITDPTGQIALSVNSVRNMVIQNNDFTGGFSTALRLDGSNSTNTIDNNNMSDAASIALHFTNGNNQGNIITNNQIKSDTHYGIYYNYGTPGEIHNNDLTNSLNGIFLSGATNFSFTSPSSAGPNKNIYGGHTSNVLYYQSANGGTIEDWDMSSLITDPTGQIALSVNSVRNMVIQNNDFTGGFSTALRLDGSNSTNTIDNNNMSDAASIALHFTNGNNQGNIITNNQIKSDTHYGIYYNYGTPGEIHNNDLTNSLNGIFLSGATNFSFTSPSSAGPNKNIYGGHTSNVLYYQSANGGTIEDWDMSSLITDPTGQIALSVNSVRNMVIQNNDFTGGFSTALRLDGSNSTNTIDNNNMSDAASIALHFTNGNNQGNIITNNQIKSDTHYGIYYNYGTPGEIHNNDLTNSLNGIFLSGATNFSFTSPSSAGPNKNIYGGHTSNVLYYQSANGGTIEDWDMSSLITDPTGQIALSVNSVRNMVIQNNDFTGGFSTALRLDGSNSTNTIDNNNMSDAASIALHFTNGNNQGNVITNNDITNTNGYGVYYNYGTPANISGNDLSGSSNGIFFAGASNYTLGVNTLENIGNVVVEVRSSNNATIQDINVTGNGNTGIQLISSNNCTIRNIESCGRDNAIWIRSDYGASQNNQLIDNKIATSGTGVRINNNVHNTIITNTQLSGNTTDIVDLGTGTTISGSSEVSAIWCPFVDEDGPSIVTMDIDVELDPQGIATITSDMLDFGTTDTSGVASFEVLPLTFDCSNLGNNLVTITATDNLGNVSTATSTVTILDVTNPTILAQDISVELDENGQATITAADVDAGSTDNCEIQSISIDRNSFDCSDIFTGFSTDEVLFGDNRTVVAYNVVSNVRTDLFTAPSAVNGVAYDEALDVVFWTEHAGGKIYRANRDGTNLTIIKSGLFQLTDLVIDPDNHVIYWSGRDNRTFGQIDYDGSDYTIYSASQSKPYGIYLDRNNQDIYWGSLVDGKLGTSKTDGSGLNTDFITGEAGPRSIYFDEGNDTYYFTTGSNVRKKIGNNNATTISSGYSNLGGIVYHKKTAKIYFINLSNTGNKLYSANPDGTDITVLQSGISSPTFLHLGERASASGNVILTATDAAGNTTSVSTTVTVEDNIAPTMATNSINVELVDRDSYILSQTEIDQLGENSADNCSLAFTISDYEIDCSTIGQTLDLALTGTDPSGNSSTVQVSVVVSDPNSVCNDPPVAVCEDITINVNENCEAAITAADVDGGSSDPDGDQLIYTVDNEGPFGVGTHTVTLTVTDPDGETSQCSAMVTVVDLAAPTIQSLNALLALDENGGLTITYEDIANIDENCSLGEVTLSQSEFDCDDIGEQIVTITAIDESGGGPTGNFITTTGVLNGTQRTNMVTGDVDGDGLIDVLLTNNFYRNLGNGNFGLQFLGNSGGENAGQLGDIDGDGDLDAITGSFVYKWNGSSMQYAQALSTSPVFNQSVLVDIDNDGDLDYYKPTYYSVPDELYKNDGNGNFTLFAQNAVGSFQMDADHADLDGDGDQDLVVAGYYDVRVAENDGNGNLTYTSIYSNGNDYINAVYIRDMNGDGVFDIVLAPCCAPPFILYGLGGNTYGSPTSLQATFTGGGYDMAVGDIDADGDIDIAVTTYNNPIVVFENDGIGNFTENITSISGKYHDVVIADFNNDGVNDMAASQWGPGALMLSEVSLGNSTTTDVTVTIVDDIPPMALAQDVTVYLDASGQATITAADVDNGSSDNCVISTLSLDETRFDCNDLMGSPNDFALNFDGVNENISGSDAGLPVGNAARTMEVWIKTTLQGRTGHAFGYGSELSVGKSAIGVHSSGGAMFWGAWGDFIGSTNITDGLWHHIAFTNDGSTGSLYVDGNLESSRPFTLNTVPTGTMAIGSVNDPSRFFTGAVDELKIWDVAKTQAEIQAGMYSGLAGTEANLVMYYSFEDGTGSSVITEQVSGQQLSLNNMEITSDWVAGADGVSGTSGATVTLTATDASGNTSTATSNVTVVDNIAPSMATNAITVNLVDRNAYALSQTEIDQLGANSSDNCSVAFTISNHEIDCSTVGQTLDLTLTGTDPSGNTGTVQVSVTVTDSNSVCNDPPVASCQNITIEAGANCDASITAEDIDGDSTDPDGDALTYTINDAGPFGVGIHSVTLTVSDGEYTDTCDATVTVVDNTLPTAVAQNISIDLDAAGNASITAGDIDNGSSDACGIASISVNQTDFDCSHVGANTVTLTVTDVNGNASTATAAVTVNDVTGPVAVTQNISIDLDAAGNASITAGDIDNGSSDACGIASISVNQTDFDCSHVGANTVTLTVTDVNGNASTATATVTVNDVTGPVAVTQNISINLDAAGNASITAGDIDNGSSDACGIASISVNQTDFDCSHVGTNTVTLTVADLNGNASTATAAVTVNDVTDPAISGMPSNIVVTAPDTNCELPVSWAEPSASDNCSAALSSSHASGDIFSVGTTTVTYTATDPSGNAVSASFDVTVEALPMTLTLSSDLIDVGNVSCYGATDGDISSNTGGGCAPYTYIWSNGASTSDVSGVAAGTYTLTVYDSNGSSISESITLTEPDPLEAGIATPATTNDATCAFPDANLIFGYPGSNVTSVTLNASAVGGNDDYTYSWSPSVGLDNPYSASPVFSPTLEDTGCTTYGLTVTVTDDQGCQSSEFVTVNAVNVGVIVTTGNGKKAKQEHKVLICHKGKNTISVDYHAVAAHLAHGDCLGSCDDSCGNEGARSVNSSDSEETPETAHLILDPTIFPNPAPGKFTVTIGAMEDKVEMQLFNLYGSIVDQAIIEDSLKGINVEMGSDGLDAGIYMLRIISGDQITTRKVIVVK